MKCKDCQLCATLISNKEVGVCGRDTKQFIRLDWAQCRFFEAKQ